MTGAAANDRLLAAFERQAGWCRQPSPFSARVLDCSLRWLRQDGEALTTLAAVATDPLAGAVALRSLAGLHHLALLGLDPWARLWPAASSDAAALHEAITRAWQSQRMHMQRALASPPQTNEVQRSAALLPGLLHVAARTGRPISLLEIGASAGLNLLLDRYRYETDAWCWGDAASALSLRPEWVGPAPPTNAALRISQRAGCDALPVDLSRPGEDLRLMSFIWADQPERLLRLQAAMRAACTPQVQPSPAGEFLRAQLARRAAGHTTVLMHSVVWQYIAADEQAAITAAMHTAGEAADDGAPLAWLRFEPPAADQPMELRCRLWPGGADELLARCHPHGARIEWQAGAPSAP